MRTANLLFEALTGLEPRPGVVKRWEAEAGLPTRGQVLLHTLLQDVRPMLFRDLDTRAWRGGWRAKSLLTSCAMMAYLDLVAGKRVLACEVCDKPFVSGAYQARYCSERCRNTALKRAYRGRLRAAVRPWPCATSSRACRFRATA